MSELRRRMLAGEELLGTFLDLGSALAAEITAGAGFDWLVVDLEHGAGGREATLAQLQALRAPAIVRVPHAASEEIGWVLDHGAAGVLVPRVQGIRDAARAVAATRYAGARGLDPGSRAGAFGRDAGYAERADEERVVMVQIETRGALDAAGEIAALPGVDALFVGPYDLGVALGVTPGAATPEVQEAAAHGRGRRARRRQGRGGLPRRPRRSRRATASSASRSSARASRARCWPARPTPSAGRCGRDPAARPHRPARRDRRGRRGAADRRRRRERPGRGRRADRRRAGGDAPQPLPPPRRLLHPATASARRPRASTSTGRVAGRTRSNSSFLSIAPILDRSHGYDVLSTAPGRGAAVHRAPRRPTAPAAAKPQGARLQARPGAAARRPRGRGAGDRHRARRRALALGLPRLAEPDVLLHLRGAVGPDARQAPARPARADARRPAGDRERGVGADRAAADRRRPARPRGDDPLRPPPAAAGRPARRHDRRPRDARAAARRALAADDRLPDRVGDRRDGARARPAARERLPRPRRPGVPAAPRGVRRDAARSDHRPRHGPVGARRPPGDRVARGAVRRRGRCATRSSRSAARWSPRSTRPWRAPRPRPIPPRPSSARSPRSRRASSRWTCATPSSASRPAPASPPELKSGSRPADGGRDEHDRRRPAGRDPRRGRAAAGGPLQVRLAPRDRARRRRHLRRRAVPHPRARPRRSRCRSRSSRSVSSTSSSARRCGARRSASACSACAC